MACNGSRWKWAPTWYIDLAFDIDECHHPNITVTETPIDYPETLCLADPSNTYSHYQSHYGVYILDNTTMYDGRYIYYNQRLKDNHDEWYMMWYEEKDAWVINQMVPEYTVVANHDESVDPMLIHLINVLLVGNFMKDLNMRRIVILLSNQPQVI